MTTNQLTLFQQSAGVTTAELTFTIASICAVVTLVWGSWLTYGQLQRWQTGEDSFYHLTFSLARMAVLLLFLGYLLR